MATETETAAAPQPAPPAQPSGETKTGAANSTVSSFAQSLVKSEAARFQTAAVEPAPEVPATEPPESASPTAEETQVPPPEVSTETEAAAEPAETEAEAETDEALSHENTFDPKLQEKVNRRIGKEVAKRKALESRIAQLEAQVTAPPEEKTVTVPVPANVPLGDINDFAALQELQRQARVSQRTAEELLDRDDIANGVVYGDRTYTKQDLKAIIRDARVTLEDLVPARSAFLAQQQESRQKTLEAFPYLKNRASPEYIEHQAALKANPWLMAQPNADWIVAVQLRGVKAMAAEAEAAKTKPEKKLPVKSKPAGDQTAVATDTGAARVPATTLQAQARSAINKVLEGKRGVGAKDFAAILMQQEQLRNSR